MSEDSKILFVEYCADDMLGGTLDLEPLTELAYRRICDMIYKTGDNLIDNDEALKYSTKTGTKWLSIKKQLMVDHEKIYVENGRIRQKVCTEKLEKSRKNIDQKILAANAKHEKDKLLKNKDSTSAAAPAAAYAAAPANQEPKNPILENPLPLENFLPDGDGVIVDGDFSKPPERSGGKNQDSAWVAPEANPRKRFDASRLLTERAKQVGGNIVKNRSIAELVEMFSDYVGQRDPPVTSDEAGKRFIGYCKKFADEIRP